MTVSGAIRSKKAAAKAGAGPVIAADSRIKQFSLHCIMMVRNEGDIVSATANHALELFDRIFVVDICSTDGTNEILTELARRDKRLEVYICKTQERYQSAMMNRLAREAVQQGADWVFFLDGDEFLNIEGRDELQAYMRKFAGDVMHMPWINLIPTQYGDFEHFDLGQDFHWSGRVSPYRKVAVSRLYMSTYPDFYIDEGNHNVIPTRNAQNAHEKLGLGLLHLPIRSIDRLKYKLTNGIRLLASKHNSISGEGDHVQRIFDLIADGGSHSGLLNHISSNYGSNGGELVELDPVLLAWPVKRLPDYMCRPLPVSLSGKTLAETLSGDAAVEWKMADFVKGSPVSAQIDDDQIVISGQPMRGSGKRVFGMFKSFREPNESIPQEIDLKLMTEMVSASFVKIDVLRFSAWSKLIPLLYAIFALARPRRYVELGVHNGMSFFAACQIAEHLDTKTECVAVDSWVGDDHASFHSSEVFEVFRDTIAKLYPDQAYIQGMFLDARSCFEDDSVDLLHIDGYHTYKAVKEDFETWLPRMSDHGIIIFHDINVHERGFGVWRYWEELKLRYPGFGFMHSHGLGVLYVGKHRNAVSKVFDLLAKNLDVRIFAQQYFETLGEVAVEHREFTETTLQQEQTMSDKDAKILEFQSYLAHRDSIIAELRAVGDSSEPALTAHNAERDRLLTQRDTLLAQRDDILSKLEDAPRVGRSAPLSIADPALQVARAMHQLPIGKGLVGRIRAKQTRKRRDNRIRAIANVIADSGMFDAEFYLNTYADVREASIDPVWHYVESGAFELRDPSPHFSSSRYFQHNRDVLEAGQNPLYHYVAHGKGEGRYF